MAVAADSSRQTQGRTLRSMQALDATHATPRATLDWAVCAYDDGADAWAAVAAQTTHHDIRSSACLSPRCDDLVDLYWSANNA